MDFPGGDDMNSNRWQDGGRPQPQPRPGAGSRPRGPGPELSAATWSIGLLWVGAMAVALYLTQRTGPPDAGSADPPGLPPGDLVSMRGPSVRGSGDPRQGQPGFHLR